MNGPIEQEALLSLALPRSKADLPSTSLKFTSLPRVAPFIIPMLFTAKTISGSGLFQLEIGFKPTSSPKPTEDNVAAFVKTSASFPIPTSKYWDHKPSLINAFFTSLALSDPGVIFCKLSPIKPPIWFLRFSAFLGSPAALSSITLSTIDLANVTPHALITCKSQGARRRMSEAVLKLDERRFSIEINFSPEQLFKNSLILSSSSKSLTVGISLVVISYT